MMEIHENSIKSNSEHIESGKRETWRNKVYSVFKAYPDGSLSDREVMIMLDTEEPSLIRPEITRLKADGLIEECGTD